MKLTIKGVRAGFKAPERAHSSAGYDVFTCEGGIILPQECYRFPLGFSAEFDENYVAMLCDKSSFGARGLKIGGGVIDADYRGEWFVTLWNLGRVKQPIGVGDKIAQIVFHKIEHPEIVFAEQLTNTSRGTGSLGSTK